VAAGSGSASRAATPAVAALSKHDAALRRERLKLEMAGEAERIMEAPEKALVGSSGGRPLKVLLEMCNDEDDAVQRLAMLSTALVFKDIVPSYRIRLPTEKELAMPVKKEVRKMREFESTLLNSYKRFLQLLESAVRLADAKASAAGAGPDAGAAQRRRRKTAAEGKALRLAQRECRWRDDADTRLSVATVALKCMCDLLRTLSHFNHSAELIDAIVARMCHRNEAVADIACGSIRELFAADTDPAASTRAVRALVGLVKSKGVKLRPQVIDVLLSLPISTATAPAERGGGHVALGDDDADDEDAEAFKSRKRGEQAAALKDLLMIYFRLLRTKGASSATLLPCHVCHARGVQSCHWCGVRVCEGR
jgi:nucleolar complex protein 3